MRGTITRRRFAAAAISLGLVLAACGGETAAPEPAAPATPDQPAEVVDDFPNRPITLLVGFGAGGANDLLARRAAPLMSEFLGVPISVENMPGGSGLVSMAEMLDRPADGYTMVTHQAGTPFIASLLGQLPFDEEDIFVLGLMSDDPVAIATAMDSGIESLEQMLALTETSGVTIAHQGFSQPDGVAASLIEIRTGRTLTHVPYNSGPEQAAALLGRFVDTGLRAGGYYDIAGTEIRILATMSDERVPEFDGVPTFQEVTGQPLSFSVRRGFAIPSAVPQNRRDILVEAFAFAARDPRFADGLVDAIKLRHGFADAEEAAREERALVDLVLEVEAAGLLGDR